MGYTVSSTPTAPLTSSKRLLSFSEGFPSGRRQGLPPRQDAGHAAAVVPLATFRKIQRDFPNDSMGYSIQWIGLRENLQETMVFTIKLIGVSG